MTTLVERLQSEEEIAAIADEAPSNCESNIFATNAAGFSVHFKLTAEFGALLPMTEGLLQYLAEHEYAAGSPQRGAGGPPQGKKSADGPVCEFCGSASWNNTSKASGKPYLKCSNKSCNAVAPYKDRDTGEWVWKEDQPR